MNTRKPKPDIEDPSDYYTRQHEALAAICVAAGVDLAVLFGSAARKRLRPDSDLDIAVRFADDRPGFEAKSRLAAQLHEALQPPRELDLVVLNRADPLLLIQVALEGIPLFEGSDEVWPLFRLYARHQFEDTQKFRQRRWEEHKQRVLG